MNKAAINDAQDLPFATAGALPGDDPQGPGESSREPNSKDDRSTATLCAWKYKDNVPLNGQWAVSVGHGYLGPVWRQTGHEKATADPSRRFDLTLRMFPNTPFMLMIVASLLTQPDRKVAQD